jgi:hypothetical protein
MPIAGAWDLVADGDRRVHHSERAVRDDEPGNIARGSEEPDDGGKEDGHGHGGRSAARWADLLEGREARCERHQREAHRPKREQGCHRCPRALQAPDAGADAQRAGVIVPPASVQESQRASANRQTGSLQRRQLITPRLLAHQSTASVRPCAMPRPRSFCRARRTRTLRRQRRSGRGVPAGASA